jgi:Asp-tRNA(Asn)/Glu-tRNA(Gln) amidotransferase B subunit
VAPALQTMARTSTSQLARIHARWTLEGLGRLDAPLVRDLMKATRGEASPAQVHDLLRAKLAG